ncbi:MAG: polysaccharide deacetylase family protein [Candidatus Magasanikbacteria bacterium]
MNKKQLKKIFLTIKILIVVVVITGAGFIVYNHFYDASTPPAEFLDPIRLPEIKTPFFGILKTRILMYHQIRSSKFNDYYSVSPQIFEQQMQWLQDNDYEVISYTEFYLALTSSSTLPDKSVVLTFDDGYRNQYTQALPILQKFGYPAIFFPYTRAIGKRTFMTYDMLRDLQMAGMEIGSHSVSHKRMIKLTYEQMFYEAADSKRVLEKYLDESVNFFAYPYGLYNLEVLRAVKLAGYQSALTTRWFNYSNKKDGPYFAPRLRVDNNLESFIQVISQ